MNEWICKLWTGSTWWLEKFEVEVTGVNVFGTCWRDVSSISALIRWCNAQFLALGLHLHESADLEIFDILLENSQMFDESLIELGPLVKHVFKVSLAHEGKVDSLEERLSCRVYCDRCLQALELLNVLLYDLVGSLYEVLLFTNSNPDLIEFRLLFLKYCVFGLLASVDLHEMLDHVEVR